MATDDVVGTLLRRFSAGRAEHVESVAPWHTMGRRKVQEDVSSPSSAMVKTYVDDLDQPLPRRKGYFLAVQSARESALYQELEHIKVERMKDAKERTRSNLDLELREAEIRKELRGEVEDDVARREYRRKVQKFWHRSRPNSAVCRRHKVVCQGHLWTASSNHLARGGVLPAGVPRPITPTALQRALKSVTWCSLVFSSFCRSFSCQCLSDLSGFILLEVTRQCTFPRPCTKCIHCACHRSSQVAASQAARLLIGFWKNFKATRAKGMCKKTWKG